MRLFAPAVIAALWCFATQAETAEFGPASRIEWRRETLRDLFRAAETDGKPVVIVTEGDGGRYFSDVWRCPRLNALADAAHFVLIKLPVDDSSESGRLVAALHLDPVFTSSVVVLRTTARPFVELLRLRGYRDEAALLAGLAETGLVAPRDPAAEPAALTDDAPRDCAK